MENDYREQYQTDHHKTHRKPFFSFFLNLNLHFWLAVGTFEQHKGMK